MVQFFCKRTSAGRRQRGGTPGSPRSELPGYPQWQRTRARRRLCDIMNAQIGQG